MNGFNFSRNDDPGDHVFGPEYAADQVLAEEFQQETEVNNYEITEVVRRIEMAKLYQTLLTHPLFSRGTADDTLIEQVEREARSFFYERLQILVGIQKDSDKKPETSVFNKEEVEALKGLASRVMAKNAAEPVTVRPAQPTMNTLTVKAEPTTRSQPVKTAKKQLPKVQEAQPVQSTADGTVDPGKLNPKYAQKPAVSKSIKPKPMPSQAQMDSMNAQTVHNNTQATTGVAGALAGTVNQFLK